MPAISHSANSEHSAHFFADLYRFDWSAFSFRAPVVSAGAVGLCLFLGLVSGHPGAALIAGGGAFTVGFGPNQRIADSRLIPMMAAVFATSTATLAGTIAGHNSLWLVVAASCSALIYGILTARDTGISWVAQQASVALLVASAFPSALEPALSRAGLVAAGGVIQLLVTSAGLRLVPKLREDLALMTSSIASTFAESVDDRQGEFRDRLRAIPHSLPSLSHSATFAYTLRLVFTMAIATEIYRQAGVQSGYWIPMTALLIQKPAFFETLTRATLRITGTLAGAWLCSLLIAHLQPNAVVLAVGATIFSLLAYATNTVNYALFTACLTSYIVFLLSLNQIPGFVIAHRRAACTVVGGLVALTLHLDALSRYRSRSKVLPEERL